jgi:restriction system protein
MRFAGLPSMVGSLLMESRQDAASLASRRSTFGAPKSSSLLRTAKQFPEEFLAFKNTKADSGQGTVQSEDQAVPELSSATPEDMLQTAEAAIAEKLRTQLLERIQELSPAFFERSVVDLIVAMGYGGSRDSVVQKLGKSGDEGIDGVVNEDPLGLDVVYVQAKRYASDNTVGRERIQQFAGALVGQGASKGVFVTTSSFTSGAVQYAQRVPQRIILIDGSELTRLMMQYGVGVRTDRTVEVNALIWITSRRLRTKGVYS